MQKAITSLTETTTHFHELLQRINEEEFNLKPTDKWSKKEELGHLIDSAQNNIQRFIRVQYENEVHIMYHPDNWVLLNDYQNSNTKDLIELWYLLNKQIIIILEKMPTEKQETLMSFDKDASIKNTTVFIANDYVQHMTHHLKNISSK